MHAGNGRVDFMHEILKVFCFFVLTIGFPTSLWFWVVDYPNLSPAFVHFVRMALPFFSASACCGLILLVTRRDRVPDFLGASSKRLFRCRGLTFAIVPTVRDAVFVCEIAFQNDRDRPCRATIVAHTTASLFR
jgi:hypothetical protein